jgi:hypothetical protein
MKIKELEEGVNIIVSNEEQEVLDSIDKLAPIEAFTERNRFILESLIRKSLVIKIKHGNSYLVTPNE